MKIPQGQTLLHIDTTKNELLLCGPGPCTCFGMDTELIAMLNNGEITSLFPGYTHAQVRLLLVAMEEP